MGFRHRSLGEIKKLTLKPGQVWPGVSNLGRFRSIRGVITRPTPEKDGYVGVRICKKRYKVHNLMARAFIGEAPSAAHTIDHIDNNPSNNHVSNLRWCTPSEQIQHSFASNPNRASCAPKQSKPVRGRKMVEGSAKNEWIGYASATEAARQLGFLDNRNISACCRGRMHQLGGYEFEYDTTAAEPALLENEEWRDVVVA